MEISELSVKGCLIKITVDNQFMSCNVRITCNPRGFSSASLRAPQSMLRSTFSFQKLTFDLGNRKSFMLRLSKLYN